MLESLQAGSSLKVPKTFGNPGKSLKMPSDRQGWSLAFHSHHALIKSLSCGLLGFPTIRSIRPQAVYFALEINTGNSKTGIIWRLESEDPPCTGPWPRPGLQAGWISHIRALSSVFLRLWAWFRAPDAPGFVCPLPLPTDKFTQYRISYLSGVCSLKTLILLKIPGFRQGFI